MSDKDLSLTAGKLHAEQADMMNEAYNCIRVYADYKKDRSLGLKPKRVVTLKAIHKQQVEINKIRRKLGLCLVNLRHDLDTELLLRGLK